MKIQFIAKTISSTFGSGFFPFAPGTVGAGIAIAILWLLPPMSVIYLSIFSLLFYFLGVWASTISEKSWGHDPGKINWDEVVGMMVTVIAVPKSLVGYFIAFVLFRIFDVLKPFPINESQDLPKGWGVMTDDILAGIYSNIILQFIFRVLWIQ